MSEKYNFDMAYRVITFQRKDELIGNTETPTFIEAYNTRDGDTPLAVEVKGVEYKMKSFSEPQPDKQLEEGMWVFRDLNKEERTTIAKIEIDTANKTRPRNKKVTKSEKNKHIAIRRKQLEGVPILVKLGAK